MSAPLRISRIHFLYGSRPSATPLAVDCPNVVVLVGPNNSGKSRTLKEIEADCTDENVGDKLLISRVDLLLPSTNDEVDELLRPFRAEPPEGHATAPDHFWIRRPRLNERDSVIQFHLHENSVQSWVQSQQTSNLKQFLVRLLTVRLDGRTRFDLIDPKPTGDLQQFPQNHLWKLFVDDDARLRVRNFTEQAFSSFFVIDPTGMKKFKVRLSPTKPTSKAQEQALDARARAFHSKAPPIEELGDGIQTSVGLVSAIMSLPDKVLLVDEPEAFLHPTLARRVGGVLSRTARERDASLIVATHSSEFLLGCIETTPELRIVRLSRDGAGATARSLDPAQVSTLMHDPLLRSAHAMRALFHRAVIACEADSDRAFYEEINLRLSHAGRGIQDALFLNAQNWQTIPRIVHPLRSLGIPAAAVFDFDVLMDDFSALWPMLSAKPTVLRNLQADRAKILNYMRAVGRTACKKEGLSALPGQEASEAREFIRKMGLYGLFFVPVGELENWLPTIFAPGQRPSKKNWLTKVFEGLGSDPSAANYVAAGAGDVWDFVGRLKTWTDNPRRLGIPT